MKIKYNKNKLLKKKRKDDLEGKNKKEAKGHGELFPGLESQSRNCQPVLEWISGLV